MKVSEMMKRDFAEFTRLNCSLQWQFYSMAFIALQKAAFDSHKPFWNSWPTLLIHGSDAEKDEFFSLAIDFAEKNEPKEL